MNTRRDFLKQSLLGAGALAFAKDSSWAAQPGKPPMRFIFMHRGNGLWPRVMVPPGLDEKTLEKEKRKEPFQLDLDSHDLPGWMDPLSAHKENLTILQGLSGKMCTTGHHSWCSSLGVFKANERPSSIKWATVDFELAKLFPSPADHIELACFPLAEAMRVAPWTMWPPVFRPVVRSNPIMPSVRRVSPWRNSSSLFQPTSPPRLNTSWTVRFLSSSPRTKEP